jgi:hypothetical protein
VNEHLGVEQEMVSKRSEQLAFPQQGVRGHVEVLPFPHVVLVIFVNYIVKNGTSLPS